MIPEWKEIPNYKGIYLINENGQIKNIKKGRLLKGGINSKGYFRVGLAKNGVIKMHNIHKLIAECFIPNPMNYPIVRHLNDIKTDNRLCNLAWGSYYDNMQDAIKNNKTIKGEKHPNFGKRGLGVTSYGKKHKNKKGIESTTSKLILDTNTGIFYLGIKAASYAKCIGYSTLAAKLCGFYKNNTGMIYV